MSGRLKNFGRPSRIPEYILDNISWYKQKGQCFKCGLGYTSKHCLSCPARKAECRKCSKIGHFARVCWSKPTCYFIRRAGRRRYAKINKVQNVNTLRNKAVRKCNITNKSYADRQNTVTGGTLSGTQTANSEIWLKKYTTESETQTVRTDVSPRDLSSMQCNRGISEVAVQTEHIKDESEVRIQELLLKVQNAADLAESWMDAYYEMERDLREQEKMNSHLEDQIAAVRQSVPGRKRRKQKKQAHNARIGENYKKPEENVLSVGTVFASDVCSGNSIYESENESKESVYKYIPNHFRNTHLWPQNNLLTDNKYF